MSEYLEEILENNEGEEADDTDISPREGIISETDFRTAAKCAHAYYLRKEVGMSKLPRSAFAAQSLFFRNQRIKLLPLEPRAGKELKVVEKMSGAELQEVLTYKSPETCGGGWRGKWWFITQGGEYAGRELVWAYDGQARAMANQLQKAGEKYCSFLQREGAPIFGFRNKRQSFRFEGDIYLVELPEIRKWTIDDISLWSMKDLHKSNLVTMRLLAFCTIAHDFSDSALYEQKWGINRERAERWGGVEKYLDPEIKYRHFQATTGVVSVTERSDADLDNFRRFRDNLKEMIAKENYEPDHRSCGSCPYNLVGSNGKVICTERKKGAKPLVPLFYFGEKRFEVSDVSEEEMRSGDKITLKGVVRKESDIVKNVAELTLLIEEGGKETALTVKSSYDSDLRGLGFEERMLVRMDELLQNISSRRLREIDHNIEYVRDFKFTGQKSIAQTLLDLGYVNYQKTYKPDEIIPF